jgi:DNA-binding XRE family transcriptional regulator
MKSYRDHLKEELKNPQFRQAFEEEKHLLDLGLKIAEAREKMGLSQKELAHKCHVTQQQLSKIENGVNCNLLTFMKISSSLGLTIDLSA